MDGACFRSKVSNHIDRALDRNPHLVQIETAWRPPKEQRPGALRKNAYRVLDIPDNPDATPPCSGTKKTLIVFGRGAGKTVTVCTDEECPLHDPVTAARIAAEQEANSTPVMEPAPEEEVQVREPENEQRRQEYETERERLAAERKAEFERQQQEQEADAAFTAVPPEEKQPKRKPKVTTKSAPTKSSRRKAA